MPYVKAKKQQTETGIVTRYYLYESSWSGRKLKQKELKYLGKVKPTDEQVRKIIAEIAGQSPAGK